MSNEIIDFNYESINTIDWLMEHCIKADFDIRSIHHSKIKNYVMNPIYIADELSDNEKVLFTFIYDLKAQQKYLPWIYINQEKLAFILWKSASTISRDIQTLIEYNLIFKAKDRFWETLLIPNENINTWGVAIDEERLSFLEELRKHTATSNTQLSDEYKHHLKRIEEYNN